MRLRGRHYVVIAILLVAVSLCYTTWRIYHLVDEVVRDAYAQWWTGSMLVEYMKEHDDRWPKSWDDLREEYAACVKQSGSAPWAFDDLRNRVEIDFAADPRRLLGHEGAPKVVWLRSGNSHTFEGTEPNDVIRKYLISKSQHQDRQPISEDTSKGNS